MNITNKLFLIGALAAAIGTPCKAMAADVFTVDGLTYSGVPETAECTFTDPADGTKYSGDITVPAEVAYDGVTYAVTAVDAFYGCYDLTSVILPEGVRAVAGLKDCYALREIVFPNSVTEIAKWTLSGAMLLETITLPDHPVTLDSFADGSMVLSTVYATSPEPYPLTGVTFTDLPATAIARVPDEAFEAYSADSSWSGTFTCVAPDGRTTASAVAYPEEGWFKYAGIDFHVIGGTGECAVGDYRCEVEGVESGSYRGAVIIPSDLVFEGESFTVTACDAFDFCTYLTSLDFPGSVSTINGVRACPNLRTISLGEGVNVLGRSFAGSARNLSEIVIPSSVTSIGENAFADCESLASVTLPDHEIGLDRVFNSCPAITSVNVMCAEPYELSADSFMNVNFEKCVLTVPDGSLNKYVAASSWSRFIHKRDASGNSGILSPVQEDGGEAEWYDLSGRRADTLHPGNIYVSQGRKVIVK